MADELSFEEAQRMSQQASSPSPSGTPPGVMSFEDAQKLSQQGSPSATPSSTPETSRALQETADSTNAWQKMMRFARSPSPAWLQPYERTLTGSGLPTAQQWQGWARALGLPDQPGFGAEEATGVYESARQMATPANLGLIAASIAQPELAPYTIPIMTAPIAGQLPGKLQRIFTGQATRGEAAGAAADVAMLTAPGMHVFSPKPLGPVLPKAQPTELSAYQWYKKYGIPGPPVPPPGVEFAQTGERGFVGVPKGVPKPPSGEAVGEPIPQTGVTPDAIKRSDAQVQAREAALGVEARPSGEEPKPGDSDYVEREAEGAAPGGKVPQPVSPGVGAVAPETAPTKTAPGVGNYVIHQTPDGAYGVFERRTPEGKPSERLMGVTADLGKAEALQARLERGAVTEPETPEKMPAAQLREFLSQKYWEKNELAPPRLSKLLRDKEAAEKAREEPPPTPVEERHKSMRDLLSPEEMAEYQRLQTEWTDLDFDLGDAAQINDMGTVASIAARQKEIKAKMQAIESKLPDSDVYDIGVIGGGAAGQAAAVSAGGEDLRVKVVDVQEPGGASKRTPLYENITGAVAQPGRARSFAGRLAAERMGVTFDRMSGLDGVPTYDEKTKLWTVKTLGPGAEGAGGKVYRFRSIIGATGTRGRGATFPIVDASGKMISRSNFDRDPKNQGLPVTGTPQDTSGAKVFLADGISMAHEAAGGEMAAIGGANSAGQGVNDAALMNMRRFMPKGAQGVIQRPPGAGQVHLLIRGPGPEMSAPLLHKLYRLVDLGWIKIHPWQETQRMEIGPGGEKTLVTERLAPNPADPRKPIHTGELTRLPVKAVASFVGGDPVSGWLPEHFARDAEGFAVTDNQLRPLDKNGQPIKEPGIFLAGSMRSGVVNTQIPLTERGATAPAVNRMVPTEGEGATAAALAGTHVTGLEGEGRLPQWQKELRDFFNRVEHHGPATPAKPAGAGFPTQYPGTKLPIKEVGPRQALPALGGPVQTRPPRPFAESPKTAAEALRHTAGLNQQQQQQQQDQQQRHGIPPIFRENVSTAPPSVENSALINQQKTNPKPLTDVERGGLNQYEQDLRTQYDAISSDQLKAYAEGDQDRIAENDLKLSETWDRFSDVNNARKQAGEPEVPHPPEQFSPEEMLKAKSAVNKGRPLTPFERDDVLKWSNLIKEKKDALEAYRAGPESKGYWDELRKREEAYRTGVGPKKSLLPDPKNLKLQADLIRAQKDWEASLEKDRRAGLAWYNKAPDYLLKWRRAFAISGPRSIAKLAAAAMEGMILLPARELVGSGLKHLPLISEVAKRAPREGQGFNIRAESEAITETFKNLASDVGKNFKGQKPDYEMVFGKVDSLPPELQNFVGYIHGAIKSPLARDEFTRSFQTIAEFDAKHGIDITDPLVQMHIGQKAMESSVFWRLQNRNMATRVYRTVTSSLERQGAFGVAASKGLQAEFPIVTVPSNFLARTFEGALGAEVGMGRLARAYGKGIETLKPEQADLIMRNLKTGSLGTALMLLGYFAPQYFGGYYRPGGKREQEDPSAPKYGGTKIGDYEVPAYIQDNPFVALPQMGATVTQVSNSFLRKRDEDPAGIWLGIWSAIYGAASAQPFVRESIDIGKAGDPRMAGDVIGDHARSYVIPQLLQQVAEMGDPADKRYPRGFTERLMMGIPGMREQIPDVLPKPQQLGPRRHGLVPRRPGATVRVHR